MNSDSLLALNLLLGFFVVLYRKRHDIQALDRSKSVPRKLRKYEFLFVD